MERSERFKRNQANDPAKAQGFRHRSLMKIYVKVYATLRRYVPGYDPSRGLELELEEGSNVGEIIRKLNLPPEEVKTVFVNATLRNFSYPLKEGDLVGIFSPIAGGRILDGALS